MEITIGILVAIVVIYWPSMTSNLASRQPYSRGRKEAPLLKNGQAVRDGQTGGHRLMCNLYSTHKEPGMQSGSSSVHAWDVDPIIDRSPV